MSQPTESILYTDEQLRAVIRHGVGSDVAVMCARTALDAHRRLAAAEALLARRPHLGSYVGDIKIISAEMHRAPDIWSNPSQDFCAKHGGACATIEAVEPAKGAAMKERPLPVVEGRVMHSRVVDTGELLKAEIVGDRLRIEIGLNALAFACEHAPNLEYFNEAKGEYEHPVITDPAAFAKEVLRALNREEEDGTTPIHRLLDAAYEEAIEQGAEGVKMPGDDD